MKLFSSRTLLLVALSLSYSITFGQVANPLPSQSSKFQSVGYKAEKAPNGQIRCYTMEADSILRANNPNMPSLAEEEQWLQQKIAEYKAQQALNPSKKVVVTIPIIFHIFTDGTGAENIPQSVCQDQVDQLNLDFRDLAGSPFAVAADCEVEFCLAITDPLGGILAEPGVNRITTYGDGPFTQADFQNTLKPATQWNPDDYFNVWVADLSGGLLGYAQFPSSSGLPGMPGSGGAANTDGCVILYSSLGSVANPQGSPAAPFNKGRTLTHEAGHWLGLRHIWGDGNCTVDDFCDDTPISDGSNFGCPTTNSCTDSYTPASPWWPTADPDDMVENYMDYSDDACMNTFTNDQKTRVLTVLANSPRRGSLTTSTACNVPNADDAGILAVIVPQGTICTASFDPIVTLNNYGNNNLTSVDIVYDIDGGAPLIFNWTGNLAPGTNTNVTLPTMSPTTGPHVFNVSTQNPNGVPDSNTANDDDLSNFTIDLNPGTAPPIVEGFVAVTFPPTNWSLNNGGNALTWVRSGTQGTAPTAGNSAVIDNYNINTTGDLDDIVVEPKDFTGYTSATLSFDVAYARYNGTYFDQLDVLVSVDCGQTWNTVYSKAGTVLATDPDQTAGYTNPATWRNEVIDMTPFVNNSKVEILFRNISGWGQYLYVDNINLTGVLPSEIADFTVNPDPSCVGENVTFTDNSTGATSWDWNFGAGATPATATGVGPHVVTYSSAGTPSVTLSINGGADVSVQSITVNPLDDASFNYTASSYCENDGLQPATITGLAGGTFSSSPAGLFINTSTGEIDPASSTPGSYTVTYTTNGTCPNSSDVTVDIFASPAIPAVTPSGPTTFCTGGSVDLTSSYATNNVWSTTETTQTINVTSSGSYSVTYTDGNGCSSSSANIVVTVNPNPSAPTVTPNGPTTFCAGGSVDLTSSYASGNLWSTTETTQSISVTSSGSYSVTYTDGNGCSATSSPITVTVNANPTPPTVTPGGPTTFCSGGSVDLTSNYGTNNVWSTTETTQTITVNSSGSYSVTYTDGNGCSATSTPLAVTVNPNPAAPVITPSGPTTFCSGGSVDLTSDYGSGNVWSTTETTQTISVNSSGSYTVTYTDGNGCSATSTPVNVTVNALPAAPVISPSGPTTFCDGGSVDLTSDYGSGNVWSTTETTQTITATSSGSYTVTYTDGNGCSATSAPVNVTVNALPTSPTVTPSGPTTFCSGGSVDLTSSYGTNNVWSTTETTQTITVNSSGTYTVTYTDGNGCSATSAPLTVTVNSNPAPPTITPSGPTTFCDGGSVQLTSSQAIGNTWSTGSTSSSINVIISGTYTVTYTDGNGCSATSAPVVVTVNPAPVIAVGTVTDPTACATATGSIEITGSGTGVVSWTGPVSGNSGVVTLPYTITNLFSGSYSISFVDGATGCASNVVNQSLTDPSAPAAPTITPGGPLTFCAGGSVDLTSSYATGNVWSTTETTQTITVNTSGTYTVTYVDGFGCSSTSAPVTVTVNSLPPAPVITPAGPTTFCDGGSVDLISSEGSGNVWSTTETTQTINVTSSGSYTVTYTDGNGCSATSAPVSVTVNLNPGTPVVTPSGPTTFCAGGSVDLSSSYGTNNVWSTAETTQTINVTSSGSYSVTYTDGNGCTATSAPVTVTVNPQPAAPVISASGPTTFCSGGSVDLTSNYVSGNVWSTSATTQGITVTTSGTYSVTYTDGNGCTATSAPTTVTVNPLPTAPIISAGGPTTFCAGGSVVLTSSETSGNLWSTSQTSQSITVASSGTYTVTFTDGNGCTATSAPVNVTVNALPTAPVITPSGPTTFCDGGSVNLTSDYTSGNTWSTSETTQTINVTSSGSYTVTYTDGNGCSAASAPVNVTVNPLPIVSSANVINPTSCGASDGSIEITGTGTGIVNWTGASSGSSGTTTLPYTINGLTAGSYTISFVDGSTGCSSNTISETLNDPAAPAAPVITPSGATTFCDGGSVDLSSDYTSGNVWSTSETTQTITVNSSGTYTVTYTDGNSCSATSSPITVTVNANPTAPVITASGSTTLCDGESVDLSSDYASGNVWSTSEITQTITVNTAGTYTVTYTDGNGCSSTSTATTVTMNPLPTVDGGPNQVACEGDSIVLSGTGALTYVWDNGVTNNVPFTQAPGTVTYTVTGTDGNGCANTDQVDVIINALPSVTLDTLGRVCLQDASYSLTGGVPAGGTYSGTGVSGGVFDPSVSGVGVFTITYSYTDGNGCSNSASNDIIVEDCSGLTSLSANGYHIYPNPVTDYLEVKASYGDIGEIDMYDAAGRLVFEAYVSNETFKLSMEEFAPGVYNLVINNGKALLQDRIIKY